MGLLIFNEVPLKGRHLRLAVHRRPFPGPDVPDQILPQLSFLRLFRIISPAGMILQHIVERLPAVGPAAHLHTHEAPILIQRHAAVIQEVSVVNLVHPSLGIQEFHMPLQLLTPHESLLQAQHHLHLILHQIVRVLRIDGREIGIEHGVFLPVHLHGLLFVIDPVQEHPVLHMKFRMPHDDLPLQLKLDDSDRLVHLGVKT